MCTLLAMQAPTGGRSKETCCRRPRPPRRLPRWTCSRPRRWSSRKWDRTRASTKRCAPRTLKPPLLPRRTTARRTARTTWTGRRSSGAFWTAIICFIILLLSGFIQPHVNTRIFNLMLLWRGKQFILILYSVFFFSCHTVHPSIYSHCINCLFVF